MKIVYTGLESSGKTLLLAKESISLIKRNRRWKKKYGFIRKVVSNLKFSDEFYEKNKEFIDYWEDMRDVIGLTGCDIIWDEISSDFSALKKEPMSKKINRWLRQGAKQGVHIYATAQEFHDIHLDFRRRVQECLNVVKVIGSARSGKNLPPVNKIWGFCFVREINIHPYNELEPENLSFLPSLLWITRDLCEVFDTHQVILSSKEPLLEHIERFCEKPGCNYKRVIHR
jgi:hypothetical protein